MNEAMRSISDRHGVSCLEFAAHPQADVRGNFAHDGFHPSADGNRRTAAVVIRSLERHFGIEAAGLAALAGGEIESRRAS
jgi:hypothetical protein